MKTILFLLFLIPFAAIAGDSSRVVFFHLDRWGKLGSSSIYHDDSLIAAPPRDKLYIYNTDKPSGKYFWGTMDATKDHSRWGTMEMISVGKNSITFVELKPALQDGLSGNNSMHQVRYTDFEKYYQRNKGLRERLRRAGYNSVEELAKGYTPSYVNVYGQKLAMMRYNFESEAELLTWAASETDGAFGGIHDTISISAGQKHLLVVNFSYGSGIIRHLSYVFLKDEGTAGWSLLCTMNTNMRRTSIDNDTEQRRIVFKSKAGKTLMILPYESLDREYDRNER